MFKHCAVIWQFLIQVNYDFIFGQSSYYTTAVGLQEMTSLYSSFLLVNPIGHGGGTCEFFQIPLNNYIYPKIDYIDLI